MNRWIEFFATACRRAVADAESFEERVRTIRADWERRIVGTRSDAAAHLLIDRLPEMPIVNVSGLASGSDARSRPRVTPSTFWCAPPFSFPPKKSGRRRTYEAREIIDAFTLLERQLASPDAHARVAKPKRRVPARPTD
jgi:hypothetical protein